MELAWTDSICPSNRIGHSMSSFTIGPSNRQAQVTAFGELQVAQLTGKVLGSFAYNINPELFYDNSTASGSLSVANSFALISSGAATSSTGKIQSIGVLEYQPGMGGLCRFTAVYDTPVVGNSQLVGVGNDNNGFFIGYNGTDLVINRRKDGTNNFTTQANFSEDKLDGTGPSGMTIDTSKGNVFQIQYQWLGFGEIGFFIENQFTGSLFVFHRIKYTNSNTFSSISNPILPFQAESINTTNNTDIVLKVGSCSLYSEGVPSGTMYLVHGANNTKSGISTLTNIITIRNNATYAGANNLLRIQPLIVSAGADGAKPSNILCVQNATLGGSPSFVDFNSNSSPVSIDTAGTTVTGGINIASFVVGKTSSDILYLDNFSLRLAPGNTLTIAASSAANSDVSIGVTWSERFS